MKPKMTRVISNIIVGEPDVDPTAPSHTRGVLQGNSGRGGKGGRRATGIRAAAHEPIDPKMPKIPPA